MTIVDDITGRRAPWPPVGHADRLATQDDYERLYRNRRDEILSRWSADLRKWLAVEDELVPYPAPKLAARTLAAFLFGEDPRISHEDDDVREALLAMSTATNLPARFLEGAITQAVEGEIYLRPAWDADVSPEWAIPTVVPGARVIPGFRFGILADAVIVHEYRDGDTGSTVYRHLEHHERGTIRNRLYRGTSDRLGGEIGLDEIVATRDLEEEITTGVDKLLMVHVPLARDATSPHGSSLFDGLESLILALHRLYSQEQHDSELSRKRIALPESYVGRTAAGRPSWDRRTDLFPLSEEAEGAVGSDRNPVIPIEFDDDLVMRDRIRGRLEDFLIACGISPATITPQESGGAISGTSRKLAQATTLRTVAAGARYWQDAGARFLGLMLDVTAANVRGGSPTSDVLPTLSLSDGLVDDPLELARILSELDTAEAISTIEKVRRLHPEWTEDEILAEVGLILERSPNAPPPPVVGTFGPGDEDDGPDGDDLEDDAEVELEAAE